MSAVLQESVAEPRDETIHVSIPVTAAVTALARPANAMAIAQSYEIDCADTAQSLANDLAEWGRRIDRIEAMKKDLLAPAKKALEELRARLGAWFDSPLADLVEAREVGKAKLLAWQQAEERRVAEENAKREAEARRIRQEAERKAAEERAKAEEAARAEREKARLAEEERAKAAAEADRLRREGDAKAAAEADRVAREKAAEAAKAEERERQAVENGAARAQAAQLQAAAATPAAVATVTAIKGTAMKDNWVAELAPGFTADGAKLEICRAIVAGRHDLLALIEVDTAPRGPLNKIAAALKSAFNIPGYRAVNKQSLASSRK